jgi:hypothetical protein
MKQEISIRQSRKKSEDQRLLKEFGINTGSIFLDIQDNWAKYDRDFLEKDFQDALIVSLNKRNIISAPFKTSEIQYFENYTTIRQPRDLKEAQNPQRFPFPDYYLKYNGENDPYPSIISFDAPCLIEKEDYYFRIFFALKITTVDIFKLDEFLKFHLNWSFKKNTSEYFQFLNKLILQYDELLKGKFQISIQNYMNAFNKQPKPDIGNRKTKPKSKSADYVKWEGQNETEFVQLIYSLFEAGYISNQNHEITKLVTQIASLFNFQLGKNWQSNLSKSINNTNFEYRPEIFDKIEQGFRNYRDKKINKNKKNSSK